MQQTVLHGDFPKRLQCSGTLVLCIKGHASAGHRVVCIAMDQMVGNRRSTGATTLGGRECLPLLPTIALRSRRRVVYILMLCGVDCVRDGRSRTSSRVRRCGVRNASCCGSGSGGMTLRSPSSQLLRQRQLANAKALRRPWPTVVAAAFQLVKTLRRLRCRLLWQRQVSGTSDHCFSP